jgi:sorbitol-specific phosphotransferase system component IIBC
VTGREADSQQDTQKKAKAKQTDRRQVDSSRLTGSQVVRQAGRHAGRLLAGVWQAGRRSAGIQVDKNRTASMKQ